MSRLILTLLPRIEAFAREFYRTLDFAHDESHGERVVAHARALHSQTGGDLALTVAGAWVHQFHDHLDLLERELKKLPLPQDCANQLLEIAELCRPHKISPDAPLEARVVFDADALDLVGPLGTVRELLCNFSHRRQSWPETVKNCRQVQQLFTQKLQTEAARKLVEQGIKANEAFWQHYDEETLRSSYDRS